MPIIKVKGQNVEVDIRVELERFTWNKERFTEDKLIASSPFRYDKSPSFYVNLEGKFAGTWGDSGYYDEEWKSGGLVKLLSFLRDETYEETVDYLLSEYGREWSYGEEVKLPSLSIHGKDDKHLDDTVLYQYRYRHPYLTKRRIGEKTQRLMQIGYDKQSKAITIPWYNADGRLANIKYRKTDSKIFWYRKGAVPIRSLVYGMDIIYRNKTEEVVLCEAEIDAMTVIEATGKAAIAVGGASFTDKQADIIKRSPIKHLTVCADNDKTGRNFESKIVEKLRGFVELYTCNFGEFGVKDANEAHLNGVSINDVLMKAERVKSLELSKIGEYLDGK